MADRTHAHRLRAAGLAATAALLFAGLTATPAAAHVGVDPASSPARGGWGAVTFTVPTESEDESTVGLEFAFPDEVDLTALRTQPLPGWSAEITRDDDGSARGIVWEADDESAGIAPGEFQSFTISAGPWPDTDEVAVPVIQHYSDGSAVEWTERSLDPSVEPEHPAPVISLSAEDGTDAHGGSGTTATEAADGSAAQDEQPAGASATAAAGSLPVAVPTIVATAALAVAIGSLLWAWSLQRRLARSTKDR